MLKVRPTRRYGSAALAVLLILLATGGAALSGPVQGGRGSSPELFDLPAMGVQRAVVSAPGLVAVGFDQGAGEFGAAAVWTSNNGLAWSRVPHNEAVFGGPSRQEMFGVVAGGPGFVAVGLDYGAPGAAVWTSRDGLTWSRVPHSEAVFGGVAFLWGVTAGGPGLVAVGRGAGGAAVLTSRDGLAWSRVLHNEAVFGEAQMFSVTAGGPGVVAVGSDTRAGDESAAVWTSRDGLTWTRVPHDAAVFGGVRRQLMWTVAAGGPGLVAGGWDGEFGGDEDVAVWTSRDGLSWRRVQHDEAVFGGLRLSWPGMTGVTAGGPGLVAIGTSNVWTSRDGLSWSRTRTDEAVFGGASMWSVIAAGPGLVAVGERNLSSAVWTSRDVLTWSRVPHDEAVFGRATYMRSVAAAVRKSGAIDYFALGDSIASGHGLMDDQTPCRRSKRAYPHVVRAVLDARYGEVDFQFKACSDATASKLAVGPKLLAYQVSQVLKRPPTRPTLVTITIGANDLGWSKVLNTMARLYLDTESQFTRFVLEATSNLEIELGRQVSRLLKKPAVDVVLTTYYNPFNKKSIFCGYLTTLPVLDRCYARTVYAVNHLNDAIERVWQRYGATKRVAIVRPQVLFRNHESPRTSCGLAPPYVGQTWVQYRTDPASSSYPLSIPRNQEPGGARMQLLLDALQRLGTWSGDCFHPNRAGARAIGDAVAKAAVGLLG